MASDDLRVILFYKFAPLRANVQNVSSQLEQLAKDLALLGRVLLAPDGVNGTLAGRKDDVQRFEEWCIQHPVSEMNCRNKF